MATLSKKRQKEIDQKISEMLISVDMSYPENDLKEIVEARDIKIGILDFDNFDDGSLRGISGMILKNEKSEVHIILNNNHSPERNTFTLAHELGHFMLHGLNNEDNEGGVKYRIDKHNYEHGSGKDIEETEANYFAASLLVPEDKLLRVVQNAKSFDEVARFFGVSVAMIKNRINWLKSN